MSKIPAKYIPIADEIIENLPAVMFLLENNITYNVLFVSPNIKEYGFRPKSFITKELQFTDILIKKDKKRFVDYLAAEKFNFEGIDLCLKNNKDKIFWVKVLVKKIFNKPETGEYFQLVLCNITGNKESELKTKENFNFSQIILDSIPTPIYYKDKNGKMLSCNMAFEKLIGVSKYRYLNKKWNKLFTKQTKYLFLENDDEIYKNTKTVQTEEIIKHKDGRFNYYRVTKSPFLNSSWDFGGFICVIQDITEEREIYNKSRENEELTKKSEYLFRSLWENSLDGMRLIDENGIILLVNDAFCKIAGKKPEELIGRQFTVIYKDNSDKLKKYKNRYTNNQIKTHSEEKVFLWNNNEYWLESLNTTIAINNTPPLVLSVIRNVSTRKLIENELKRRVDIEALIAKIGSNLIKSNRSEINEAINENLEILGNFLHTTFIGVFVKMGNMINLNHSWYKNNQSFGNTFLENYKILSNLKIYKKLLNSEVLVLIENIEENLNNYRIRKSDLEKYNTKSVYIIPIVANNELKGYIGIESDIRGKDLEFFEITQLETIAGVFINALKRKVYDETISAEKEELEVTLKSITDGVLTVDKNDIILSMNNAAENIFGYTQEELVGKNIRYFTNLIFNDEANRLKEDAVNFLQFISPSKEKSDSFNIITKKKENLVINVSVNKLQNKNGTLMGYIYVIWDLTERLNVEKQLAFSQKMESIGQLAAGVAHEINTPMQYINDNNRFQKDAYLIFNKFILEFEDRLISTNTDESVKSLIGWYQQTRKELDIDFYSSEIPKAIEQSQLGIDRVIKIIKAMKDFSHPGQKDKNYANINNSLDVTATISKSEWKYFADLEFELYPKLPEVICTVDEINQVFLNIIINAAHAIDDAIKNGKKERGLIKIKTKDAEKFIEIIISDTGCGIKEENLDKIFNLFFTTKKVGKGTGQGLSIAHDIIVNKHNGKIFVESKVGLGTTFRILLPK
ncbi:MAG: PAS domain S-box protein [bacterium]